jgi:aspartyl-tRNA(Asn)/glutamyl-tRNA(Gln) amidotransferase subunit C
MIKKEEVRHIAKLARVGLNEEELDKFSHDLSAILDWIKEMEEVEIENVEPIRHITGVKNVSREDRAEEFSNKDGIIDLFPDKKERFDKVKSVL